MILGLRIRAETEEGVFLYEFGTHIKKLGVGLEKVGLSEKEILRIKEEIQGQVKMILSKVGGAQHE